jgi:hypothetical protein|nr:MAG TPA: hypothetical protein [Caudoviricetes sp.]
MKVKFKVTKHSFDWKAFLGWLVVIALIAWLLLK